MMKFLLSYFLILMTAVLSGQSVDKSVIASSGNTMAVSEVSIGFTIGEPIVGFTAYENFIDQGFWAGPFQVENITEQKELDDIVVYPNPVVNELSIFTDATEFTMVATRLGSSGPRFITSGYGISDGIGSMIVNTFDANGDNEVATFSFVIYKD